MLEDVLDGFQLPRPECLVAKALFKDFQVAVIRVWQLIVGGIIISLNRANDIYFVHFLLHFTL